MTRDVAIFLGPSLPVEQARVLLDAEYLPPIRRGDLPALLARRRPRHVAIVDGEFGQSLAVSLWEVRAALQDGITVWGASSMGALRAAEAYPLGMRGVGWIYTAYREGRITADDEVALLFDPRSQRPVTEPLVNIRWAIEEGVRRGVLDARRGESLAALAATLPFAERDYDTLARAAAGTVDAAAATSLAAMVAGEPHAFDRKRLDAIALLSTLMREP